MLTQNLFLSFPSSRLHLLVHNFSFSLKTEHATSPIIFQLSWVPCISRNQCPLLQILTHLLFFLCSVPLLSCLRRKTHLYVVMFKLRQTGWMGCHRLCILYTNMSAAPTVRLVIHFKDHTLHLKSKITTTTK